MKQNTIRGTFLVRSLTLEQFIDQILFPNRICKECGQDHSYRPTFEGVKTSIGIIPELIRLTKRTEKFYDYYAMVH